MTEPNEVNGTQASGNDAELEIICNLVNSQDAMLVTLEAGNGMEQDGLLNDSNITVDCNVEMSADIRELTENVTQAQNENTCTNNDVTGVVSDAPTIPGSQWRPLPITQQLVDGQFKFFK